MTKPTLRLPTLQAVLWRAHLGIVLFAVLTVGITLTVAGLVALHVHAEQNLALIARSMRYTVEASAVFRDPVAAEEAIALIASAEDVAEAKVVLHDGRILANWARPGGSRLATWLEQRLAALLNPPTVTLPIVHEGAPIANLIVRGHVGATFNFLISGLGGLALCLVISAGGAIYLSRRMRRTIVKPLEALAGLAHAVRQDRTFNLRVPPAKIKEINSLGDDFNALFDELEVWDKRLQKENASLAHQASHDTLTGLPNRAFFIRQLNRAIRDAQLTGHRVAVLFLDCDKFKEINDRRGHAAGDAVLVAIAKELQAILRADDLVARFGGDEFVVLLKQLRRVEDATRVADSIAASVTRPIALPSGDKITVSLSAGIAVFPDHAQDASVLIHLADSAMYRVKRAQRGGWQTASTQEDADAKEDSGN
ncbi:diguanylate cyclase domain-containing protein [Roseococcus pinisoli]|uniref:Diguanylate cyclase n=1 Tax=Roseococcus pinisoli TaxID=2835040 RepID=A0ABS5QDA3_9PROT|nr:diguanylate cyclase [Roseococcus pinisoli]